MWHVAYEHKVHDKTGGSVKQYLPESKQNRKHSEYKAEQQIKIEHFKKSIIFLKINYTSENYIFCIIKINKVIQIAGEWVFKKVIIC